MPSPEAVTKEMLESATGQLQAKFQASFRLHEVSVKNAISDLRQETAGFQNIADDRKSEQKTEMSYVVLQLTALRRDVDNLRRDMDNFMDNLKSQELKSQELKSQEDNVRSQHIAQDVTGQQDQLQKVARDIEQMHEDTDFVMTRIGATVGGWGQQLAQLESLEIDCRFGGQSGLQVDAFDEETLRVKEILNGRVKEWNAENADRQVTPGSKILQINNVCGSSAKLLEELQKDEVLKITMMVPKTPKVGPSRGGQLERGTSGTSLQLRGQSVFI